MECNYDVVIVGAGLQGLAAARIFLQLEPELNLLIVDSNMSVGGVWAKKNLYPGLKTNNLRGTFEYTDFPMDDALGVKNEEHIPGEVNYEYFRRYAEKHDLMRRIEFGQKVVVAEKLQLGWRLELETAWLKGQTIGPPPAQRTVRCSKLIIATGLTSAPVPISITGSEEFAAPIVNFGDFAREAARIYEDSSIAHVTVLGGGKAAYDIVYLMATHGKRVTWIIRASGHGATYMAPAHLYIGPFRCWIEKLTTTRPLTWLSPCVWGDADGFGFVRNLLHGTSWGRRFVDTFWAKMASDTLEQSGVLKSEATKTLVPDQPMFWYGVSLGILNYPKDIYDFVRSGQVEVIRKEIRSLEATNTVRFGDGTSVQTDAFVASMGWKWTPSIEFRPKEIHADLGLPSTEYTNTQKELWDKLDAEADVELFERFPKLATAPKMDQESLVEQEKGKVRQVFTPWRLWRGMAPPSLPNRDIVFLGVVQQFQGAVRSEITSIWAYAYMNNKLGSVESISKPSKQLRLEQTIADGKGVAVKQIGSVEDIMYDTALFQRWGKWRMPYGFGARYPDIVFEGIPYFDMLLQDLGLRSWRKGWGWLGEVFGGSYGQADYRGLVVEWEESQRLKTETKPYAVGQLGAVMVILTSAYSPNADIVIKPSVFQDLLYFQKLNFHLLEACGQKISLPQDHADATVPALLQLDLKWFGTTTQDRPIALLVLYSTHTAITFHSDLITFSHIRTAASMVPRKATSPPPDPMDMFPFRGQYGGSAAGAALFVAVRAAVPLLFYSLLAPPTSTLSIFSKFPSAYPSRPPPADGLSVPFFPDVLLRWIEQSLGLPSYSAMMFLGAALPSVQFVMYNVVWRREKFPMSGQGGSIQVTTQVNFFDSIHAPLFVYLASRNPTWSPTIYKWTPIFFVAGLSLHFIADHSKYQFRKDMKNRGKVYTGGVWGLVRHPNFLGFTIWRTAFATAAGGWGFGLLALVMFAYILCGTSVRVLEGYMDRAYGKEWKRATEKVKWKMVPGI